MSKINGAMHTILGRNLKDPIQKNAVVRIHYENNHSKFTLLDNNRDIDQNHVETLIDSIKRKGQLMPIIVNEKLEVHEGQHRLKACEELRVPIGYVVHLNAKSKDISVMNNSQKPWKNKDYLKHYSHKSHYNNSEYRKIESFIDKYPLPFHTAIMLLSGVRYTTTARSRDRGSMPSFRNGTFEVVNLNAACTTAEQLINLKSFVPHLVAVNRFCLAFIKLSMLNDFNVELAYKQIEKNSNHFDRCNNQEDWYQAMISAYNYKLRVKGTRHKRISIRKEGF